MPNPFLERSARTKNLTNSHKRAKKQERELAGKLNGRLTAASGAKDIKGDVRIKNVVRIEAKTTKNKSYSVTLETIEKIEAAAVQSGEMGILIVEFNDNFGRKIKDMAIMSTYALETLLANQR
jgi:Holliday junction resolvase